MKNLKTFTILLLAGLLFLGSCSFTSHMNPVEVASDAASAQVLIPAIAAGMFLATDSEGVIFSRAIALNGDYDNDGTIDYATPDDAYAAGGGSGTVSIGGSTPLSNFYGNDSYKADFTMEPVTGGYKIVLRVYPLANFDVAYEEETYYVTNGSWQNYTDISFSTHGFEDLAVRYADGSRGVKTILALGGNYDSFEVPSDVIAYSALYLLDENHVPASTGTSIYSVKVQTVINNKARSVEFYTEQLSGSETLVSSININDVTLKGGSMRYVSRFSQNLDTGSYIYRSLGQNPEGGWSSTEIIERNSTIVDGTRVYLSSEKLYYNPIENLISGQTADEETILDIRETSAGSGNFEGTMTTYWGDSGNSYSYSLERKPNGTTQVRTKYLDTASRSLGEEIIITLNDLDLENSINFTFPGSSASFSGEFFQGSLVGTYLLGSRTARIEISRSGISVDDQFFSAAELESPY